MITKAVITEVSTLENKYIVNIPLFESPGVSSQTSKLSNTLFSATLSHEPSLTYAYNVGDVVFVSFEDDELDRPIILGKLYLTDEEIKDRGKLEVSTLKVHDQVTLPKSTIIGDIDFSKLFDYFNSINEYIDYLIENGGSGGVADSAIKDGSGRVIEDTYYSNISDFWFNSRENEVELELGLETPTGQQHLWYASIPLATQDNAGVMSLEDKTKLDNITEDSFGVNIIRLV